MHRYIGLEILTQSQPTAIDTDQPGQEATLAAITA